MHGHRELEDVQSAVKLSGELIEMTSNCTIRCRNWTPVGKSLNSAFDTAASSRCNIHSLIRQVAEAVMVRLAAIPCPRCDKTDTEVWKEEESRMQIKCDVRITPHAQATRHEASFCLSSVFFLLHRWNMPTSSTVTTNKCKRSRF